MEIHHKLKPIKNWREFAKEVGIIVIGVLIALSGEQAVEAIHHRSEVREVREALNEEMAWNLASLKLEGDQSRCQFARLDELEKWKKSQEAGRFIKLGRALPGPSNYALRTSIWHIASGDAVSRMPFRERTAYAKLYDGTELNDHMRATELAAWDDLRAYEDSGRLNADQLLQVGKDIRVIRGITMGLKANYALMEGFASDLGITPGKLPALSLITDNIADGCKPLLTD